ncbi:MAG: c-type cytochrome [Chloroflexi bacterium]|uniref:c-type cytochrome n=1 Tax=Candidatus Flexifilum breve TaxID=3140694 RepID=UPI0031346DA2|nr:c-type cytochrome [Chloroflexota bacterium]
MFKRSEFIARLTVGVILIGLPALILGYQFIVRPQLSGIRTIDISASSPENGGFQPNSFSVTAGETVMLRFTSIDVTHGVAIGPGLGVDLGQIDPGHIKEVTLTFDEAGTYTFYCNTWCSVNHWRMRGVIDVRDRVNPNVIPTALPDPVIAALVAEGVDIDASVHNRSSAMSSMPMDDAPVLVERPSAERGATIAAALTIPTEFQDDAWRQSHTPQQAIALLLTQNPNTPQTDLADAVAYLWTRSAASESLARAAPYYAQNCAACHGETGGGDGFMAAQTAETPVAFADPNYLFTMRGDVLYAKIRRGGMGTDMPNFGTLLTPDETWALVDYLWSLSVEPNNSNR